MSQHKPTKTKRSGNGSKRKTFRHKRPKRTKRRGNK